MKFSTLQILAIVCFLALGFMPMAPFVQTADAHGDSHSYTVPVTDYKVYICSECSSVIWAVIVGTSTQTRTHPDGGGHSRGLVRIVSSTTCGLCDDCEASSS